jgi:hypothetical protein
LKDGWSHRNDENVLFMFYEDLILNLPEQLKKLSTFLNKPINDDDLPKLMDHLHIKNFKNNPSINCRNLIDVKILSSNAQSFIRNGNISKNSELTKEMSHKIDKWMEKNLKDTDIKFPELC